MEPSILYFGTPVVLISSNNEDGSANLAPMSSAFWLGWRAVLGLAARSKTGQNLSRTGECVLNLPTDSMAAAVDQLALTTGNDPVPERKRRRGYRFEPDKFGRSGLSPIASDIVAPPRVGECPIQLECVIEAEHPVAEASPQQRGSIIAFEARVLRVHAHESVRMTENPDHIDPDAWRPLIMSFQRFYGLGSQVHHSTLASIPERLYRTADLHRARQQR